SRSRSLDSGRMLCRLNHELLPEPGSPIASTTLPLLGCAAAAGLAPVELIAGAAAGWGVNLAASPATFGRAPLPRPPRPRRRREGRPSVRVPGRSSEAASTTAC